MERMADPAKAEGEWVAMVDLVEDGPRLRLAEQAKLGKCGAECKTVQRAAAELLEAHDTDMAERLFQARAGDPGRCARGGPRVAGAAVAAGSRAAASSRHAVQRAGTWRSA